MPNRNYPLRRKEPKKPFALTQQERVNRLLDIIFENKEITEYDVMKITGWGPGVTPDIRRIVKSVYPDMVEWHFKTRTWKQIPVKLENPIEETIKEKSLKEIPNE